MSGVPPPGEVLLLGFGRSFAAFNPATGELRRLPEANGGYELVCDHEHDDNLSIRPGLDAVGSTPVSQLFKMWLEEDGEESLVKMQGRPPQSLWDLRCQFRTVAMQVEVSAARHGLSSFKCEAYHFAASKAAWTVFWVYGFLSDALGLTNQKHFRYATLSSPWKSKVAELLSFVDSGEPCVEDHFKVSCKAAVAKAASEGVEAIPLNMHGDQTPDHAMSTFALFVVLSLYAGGWVHKRRAKNVSALDIVARAKATLDSLTYTFASGDAEFVYDFEGSEVPIRLERRDHIVKAQWCSVLTVLGSLRKLRIDMDEDGFASVPEAMTLLMENMLNRHLSESRVIQAKFLLACFCDIMCAAVEISKGTSVWSSFELCRLPFRMSLKRRRRLSPAFKINATQMTARANRIRTVNQLISAKEVFENGSSNGNPRNPLRYAHTERFNYLVSSLKAFDGCKCIGVACDGATLGGGDELLAVNIMNGDTGVCAWGPPQARQGGPVADVSGVSLGVHLHRLGRSQNGALFDTCLVCSFFRHMFFGCFARHPEKVVCSVFDTCWFGSFFDTCSASILLAKNTPAVRLKIRTPPPLPTCIGGVRPGRWQPQVQRVLRWRKGVTRKYSADDKRAWQAKIRTFMQRPAAGETAAARKKRLTFMQSTLPRAAAFNWLRDLSNSIACMSGLRWRDFLGQQHLLDDGAPLQAPVFVVLCTDEESKQISAVNFLKWKNMGFIAHIRGPIHRRTNDTTLAFKGSGQYKRMCANVVLYKLKYGPWLSGGFGELIKQAAGEIGDNWSANDPLLVKMFPDILRDAGQDISTMNTEEHRADFLRRLPSASFVTKKPTKCSLSRFNSYSLAAQELDGHWTALSFVLITLSIIQGWSKHFDEYFLPPEAAKAAAASSVGQGRGSGSASSSSTNLPPAMAAGADRTLGGVAVGGARSASSSAPPDAPAEATAPDDSAPAFPSRMAAAKAAKLELTAIRAKSVNTCHAVARMMVDDDIRFESRLVNYLMEAETVSAGVMLTDLKGSAATLKFYSGWSAWSWLAECKAMLSIMGDAQVVQAWVQHGGQAVLGDGAGGRRGH